MKRKMKKTAAAVCIFLICLMHTLPCQASTDAGAVINDQEKCSLYIDYKEDIEGTDPVVGAVFTACRIARINEFGEFEPSEDILKNEKQYTAVTGADGRAVFTGLEAGLYRIEEVQPAADHLPSTSCTVQIPFQEGGKWTYSRQLQPKSVPLGRMRVSKTVRSTRGHEDEEFHFRVTLEGVPGRDSIILTLKDGESAVLDEIPVGTAYTVIEEEADSGDFITVSTGAQGHIMRKTMAEVSFINTQLPPPTGDIPLEYISGGISLAAIGLACILIMKLRRI